MNVIEVHSLNDPRVCVYANMRDAELAQRRDPSDPAAHAGVFIAEGELVVRRLISSRFQVQSVLTTPTRLATIGDALDALPAHTPVYLVSQVVMDAIVGFNMHRGLLAVGLRGVEPTIDELLDRTGPVVVLEDINNHDNIGGVFRNVAALAGPDASVILSPRCCDPLYRKALRVSIGCVLSVPWARAEAWPNVLEHMATRDILTLAMTPNPPADSLSAIAKCLQAKPTRFAIILGAEGPGLTDAALRRCAQRVRIEMHKAAPEVDSLNVHVAASLALYELWARHTPGH